jgi:TetR/AcrR family transcriptional repressor of uid operon
VPKIRPETAEKRRMQILNAAHCAFNRDGINVSVDQICAEAGVSKGNFYGYFESKDDLILAIARDQGELIRGARRIETVDELINRIIPFQQDGDVSASRFELEAWTYSLSNPELRSTFQQNLQDLDRSIAMDLQRLAPGPGKPSKADALQAAEILRIFAVGMMANTAIVDQTDNELIESVKKLIDLLIANGSDPASSQG